MNDVDGSGFFRFSRQGDTALLVPVGDWRIRDAARIDAGLMALPDLARTHLVVDLEGLRSVDTAGAWLIYRTIREVHAAGGSVDAANAAPAVAQMLQQAALNDQACAIEPPWGSPLLRVVARIGRASQNIAKDGLSLIAFIGAVTASVGGSLLRPWRIRGTSLVHHLEQTTLNAVPIVALISFLIDRKSVV